MVIYENYGTNAKGVALTRAYSDGGFYIERDGIEYAEAIDPTELNRQYTETEHLIEDEEATAEDYEAALGEVGVEV